jgi:hypothetical protein
MTGIRRGRLALDVWPLALAVLLCLPLLTRAGHPLGRDLVFVPRQPVTDGAIGLGTGAPRAVPLDAVVAVLTHVLDGGVVARVALPLVLATAGWGAHRLLSSSSVPARLATAGFAVWNPYVLERLALGQWALLAAYAALPWLALALLRWRQGDGASIGSAAAWLGLASLTPTGGLLGSLVALASGLHRARRAWWLVGLCGLMQLPWVLPALLGSARLRSDPAGVAAFSADGDGPGGVLVSVLGLGGIWDSRSVPATRESWWTPITALVVVVLLVASWRAIDRSTGGLRSRLAGCAGAGLVLALLPHLPGGEQLLRWAMGAVPGAGLLRDSQKFLAPLALLAAVALGVVLEAVLVRVRGRARELALGAVILGVALPVALLPDGAAKPWRTLDPVGYPHAFTDVADALDGEPGDLATLPWRSYRLFSWAGDDLTTSDPALRWYDRTVLVSDDLQVGSTLVKGESRRGRDLGDALERGVSVTDALRADDVSWALVYPDDPEAGDLDLEGLEPVVTGDVVELYRVPGASPAEGPQTWRRAVVVSADLGVLVVVLTGGVIGARGWVRRRRRETPPG